MSSLFSRPRSSDVLGSVKDPDSAKRKMDDMLRSGRISKEQYDSAVRRAQEIVSSLGLDRVGKI